jgi:hypothetical protein
LIPLFSLDGAPIIIGVQTERFEIPRRQFSQLFIFAGVLAGVGVLSDFLALVVLRNVPLVLLMWGTGLTLAGAFALYAAMAYTRAYAEITADGIPTRGLFGRKRAFSSARRPTAGYVRPGIQQQV